MSGRTSHREAVTGRGKDGLTPALLFIEILTAVCNIVQCPVMERLVLTSMLVTGGKRANSGNGANFYTLVEVTSRREQLDSKNHASH